MELELISLNFLMLSKGIDKPIKLKKINLFFNV